MSIREIRKNRKLTQAALAEMVGVEQAHISRMENGNRGVTIDLYHKVAEALECEITDFFLSNTVSDEADLLRAFRSLTLERQKGWLDMARAVLRETTQ